MKSIRIFDSDLTFLSEIDAYKSLIFSRKYYTYGDFSIKINRNIKNAEYLVNDNIIMLGSDYSKCGIIKKIEISIDEDGAGSEYVIATGYTLDYLFIQRIIIPKSGSVSDSIDSVAETVIKYYIDMHCINAIDTDRNMSILNLIADANRGVNINWSSRYKNLSDELDSIRYNSKMGVKLTINGSNIDIDVFEGVDRTEGTANPVIFSIEYDNIKTQDYIDSLMDYKNVGYVGGSGEGTLRNIVEVGTETGFDRYEMFIDKRNANTVDLIDRGGYELAQYPRVLNLEGEILQNGPFKYEDEWNLGDVVVVKNDRWGVKKDARITEITETYQDNVCDIEVIFDDSVTTFTNRISKKLNNIYEGVVI